jgi:Uma2 family endonuclease
MNVHVPLPATKADFLRWIADQSDGRFEFVRGKVVDMTGAKRAHVRIAANIARALMLRLNPADFEVSMNDLAVDTPEAIRYPDIVLERAGAPSDVDLAKDPIVLFEILSNSSRARDLVEKLEEFATLPSVQAYVVIDQETRLVRIWRRIGTAFAAVPDTIGPGKSEVALPEIDLILSLDDIYRGVA